MYKRSEGLLHTTATISGQDLGTNKQDHRTDSERRAMEKTDADDGSRDSLPGPSVFTVITTSPRGRAALAPFPLRRFPSSTTSGLRRVQSPFQALTGLEGLDEILRRQPEMHKVAESPTVTLSILVLAATCLTEVRDG